MPLTAYLVVVTVPVMVVDAVFGLPWFPL
jgi:hypothetical protein